MDLITVEQRQLLLGNWNRLDEDLQPVVKIFSPIGAATWLIAAMDPSDNDTMFGLCDLGMGFPELGYVTLSELETVSVSLLPTIPEATLGLERDLYFIPKYPLGVYAQAASQHGAITDDPKLLDAVGG